MIEQTVYFALGFLVAALLALAVLPAFWRRAYRLTRRELEAQLPISPREIAAERDQLRAVFAVRQRQLEIDVEKAEAARQKAMVQTGQKMAVIADRDIEIAAQKDLIERISSDLSTARDDLSATRENLRDTRARLDSAETDLAALRQRHQALEAERHQLSETGDQQRFEIAALGTNLEAQRARIEELDRTGRDTRGELARVRDELRDTERQLRESEKDRLIALRKLESAEEIAERRAGVIGDRDLSVATLKEKGAQLYKSVKDLEATLKAEARRTVQLQKQLDEKAEAADRLREEAKRTAADLTSAIERLRADKTRLQTELTEARSKAAQLQRELGGLKRNATGAVDLRQRAPKAETPPKAAAQG